MKHLFFLWTLLSIHLSWAYTPDRTYSITILHTNDHHGNFWQNTKGELGLAARSTLIKKIRQEVESRRGFVLLVDAGDVNTGIPQSDLLKAEPDFRGMSLLGYDVMALGNHEFDHPLEVLKQQRQWANFPFISANTYCTKTNKRLFPSHITKKFDDLNITIFGLTTEDTPLKSKHGSHQDIKFVPVIEEAKKIVPRLRSKSDILMALTHMGHYPEENHGLDAPGDVTLARKVNGIDLIVGGHTQKPLFAPDIQNNTIIVQAEDWGKYVGRVDLEFKNGKLTLVNHELIPVNYQQELKTLTEDEEVLDLLRPFKELGDSTLLVDIGLSLGEFNGVRRDVRTQETNLGNLISYAFKEKFSADLAITNGGGIRASLPAGKLTYASILSVLPFGNEIGRAVLSGDELKEYLTFLLTEFGPGRGIETGSFPHISGVRAKINRSTNEVYDIFINGEILVPEKIYTLAIPQFLANGGDKYPKLKKFQTFGFTDADILRSFVEKNGVLSPEQFATHGYIELLNF